METFGERLRRLREKAGLTQDQLTAASGVNLWTLRGYEQNRREPGWKVAIHLAKALNVAVEAFADCVSQDDQAGRNGEPPKSAKPRTAAEGPRKPRGRREKGK
jgi:transcriptional regulator with XRE-family HTH domain